jgi:probable rRNA maturation factor
LDLSEIPPTTRYLEVIFTTNEEIRKLNKIHRNINKATDILSFSYLEFKKNCLDGLTFPNPVLGSLVLSYDKLISQSKKFKVSIESEFFRLIVHGLLHLLGFDHENVEESVALAMEKEEDRIASLFLPKDLTRIFYKKILN